MRMIPTLLPPFLYGAWSKALIRFAIRTLFRFAFVRRFIRRAWGIVVILGKPKSRGTLRLASADPAADARIDPATFADPEDLDTLVAAVAKARRIAASESMTAFGNRDILPGALEGAKLRRWIQGNVMTTYHYAGTCRMGDDPATSVVDPELRVRGLGGLRVADASAIPETPVSALNAPSMLVGYRGGRLVRAAWQRATGRADDGGAVTSPADGTREAPAHAGNARAG